MDAGPGASGYRRAARRLPLAQADSDGVAPLMSAGASAMRIEPIILMKASVTEGSNRDPMA